VALADSQRVVECTLRGQLATVLMRSDERGLVFRVIEQTLVRLTWAIAFLTLMNLGIVIAALLVTIDAT
jgi:hypothetical protein